MQVTTKGAGLNPNAKVWQEIPAHQNDTPEGTEASPWLLTYPPSAEMTDGMSLFTQSPSSTSCKFIINVNQTSAPNALVQHKKYGDGRV